MHLYTTSTTFTVSGYCKEATVMTGSRMSNKHLILGTSRQSCVHLVYEKPLWSYDWFIFNSEWRMRLSFTFAALIRPLLELAENVLQVQLLTNVRDNLDATLLTHGSLGFMDVHALCENVGFYLTQSHTHGVVDVHREHHLVNVANALTQDNAILLAQSSPSFLLQIVVQYKYQLIPQTLGILQVHNVTDVQWFEVTRDTHNLHTSHITVKFLFFKGPSTTKCFT